MAKYIVDMEALISCLDFLSEGKMNGKHEWAYLQNVRTLLVRFPKDKVEETITVKVKNDVEISKTDDDVTRFLNKIANGEDTTLKI